MKTFFKTMTVSALIIGSLIACNKGGGGATAAPVNYFAACAGCGGMSQAMFGVQGASGAGTLGLNIQFYGNPTTMMQANNIAMMSGGCATHQYSGQVAAQGQFTVNSGFYAGSCFIPAGTYSFASTQVGTYNQGMIFLPTVEANGMTQMGNVHLVLKFGSGYNGGNMVVEDSLHDCNIDRIAGPIGFMSMSGGYGSMSCGDYVGTYIQ